jgi:hypothetical protein
MIHLEARDLQDTYSAEQATNNTMLLTATILFDAIREGNQRTIETYIGMLECSIAGLKYALLLKQQDEGKTRASE